MIYRPIIRYDIVVDAPTNEVGFGIAEAHGFDACEHTCENHYICIDTAVADGLGYLTEEDAVRTAQAHGLTDYIIDCVTIWEPVEEEPHTIHEHENDPDTPKPFKVILPSGEIYHLSLAEVACNLYNIQQSMGRLSVSDYEACSDEHVYISGWFIPTTRTRIYHWLADLFASFRTIEFDSDELYVLGQSVYVELI